MVEGASERITAVEQQQRRQLWQPTCRSRGSTPHLLRGPAILGHAQLDANDLDLRQGGASNSQASARWPATSQQAATRPQAGGDACCPPSAAGEAHGSTAPNCSTSTGPSVRHLQRSPVRATTERSPAPRSPARHTRRPGRQTPLAAMLAMRLFPACTAVEHSGSDAQAGQAWTAPRRSVDKRRTWRCLLAPWRWPQVRTAFSMESYRPTAKAGQLGGSKGCKHGRASPRRASPTPAAIGTHHQSGRSNASCAGLSCESPSRIAWFAPLQPRERPSLEASQSLQVTRSHAQLAPPPLQWGARPLPALAANKQGAHGERRDRQQKV